MHIELVSYFIVMFFGVILYLYLSNRRNTETFIIKNSIEFSNIGILVLNKKNEIIIENSLMFNFRHKNEIDYDYIPKIKEICNQYIGSEYIYLNNDKAYLFEFSDNDSYALMYDVTEEYLLHKEIEDKNNLLQENINKTLWTIDNIEKIENEKNLQKMKSKYHDIIGQNLSILHQYLINDKTGKEDIEEIKFMINKMFVDIEDTEDPFLNLQNLIKVNKNLGINVNLNGAFPDDTYKATILFEIIREAVTNAIKHAGSNKIDINISEDEKNTIMIINNNGRKPNENIIEHDGIKGMRRRVKKINGNIFINTNNGFEIKVVV